MTRGPAPRTDCNTGMLSAQAGFALRVSGWDKVRILQGGMARGQANGGFDAVAKAAGPAWQGLPGRVSITKVPFTGNVIAFHHVQ